MAKRMVGVDLGATGVRVVEVTGLDQDGFAVVSRAAVVPIADASRDEPWLTAGRITNPNNLQSIVDAIGEAFAAAGVPRYGFVLGLTSHQSAVATTELPSAVRPDERLETIRNQGKEISPLVPLNQAQIGVNHVQTRTSAENTSWDTLTIGAALSEEVDQLNKLCKLAKLTPRAIDLSGVALTRALVRTSDASREVATVVDIGATKTTIVTRRGRHVRSIRTVAYGGLHISRALQNARGDSFDEVELRKRTLRLTGAAAVSEPAKALAYGDDAELEDDKSRTKIEHVFNEAGEQLITEIATSVEEDADAHGTFTEGVSLTGGGALMLGLKETLGHRMGVPVQVGRPWATILPHKRNADFTVDGKDDPLIMQQLATAVGLALWKDRR